MNDTLIAKTFPLTRPINLSVRLSLGSVDVQMADDLTEATVQLSPGAGAGELAERFTVEMVGRTLTIAPPGEGPLGDLRALRRRRGGEEIAITVVVPAGTSLTAMTSDAPITVTGRCGGANIATGSGDICLDHVDGDLVLRYGGTQAQVARVSGSASVRSGSGDVRIGAIDGALQHACGSGGLEVGEARGAVKSRTGSGATRLSAVYGDVDLASGSGPISIGLPPGATARLQLTTGSGRVRSDLPIEERASSATSAITVRARTGRGDVQVFRAA